MVKIVGKLSFILFVALHVTCAWADISLRITDENGTPLESAGVGRPFLLHADIKSSHDIQRELVITHLDRYEHYRSGVQMTNINGARSTVYTYRCRIDAMGTHILGPAVIEGAPEKSNILSVVVGEKPEYKQPQKKEDEKVLFRITLEPEQLVVGQKAIICARFYATDSRTQLRTMTLPAISAFRIPSKQGPFYGAEEINRVKYDFIEWRYEVFAKEPGSIFIPAFCADYQMPNARSSFFFWSAQPTLNRIYSNGVRAVIDPLPPHPHAKRAIPDFVGSRAAAHASLQPAQAKIGEGILYTITFEGDGDLEPLKAPVLKGLPDGLKYYDSKVTPIAENNPDELPKKQFEYVLQGMKEGSWQIPAQQFEVFDVDQRKYITVSTLPFQLHICAGAIVAKQPSPDPVSALQTKEEVSKIRSIAQHEPWYPAPERTPINWVVFLMLVCAPGAYVGFEYARTYFVRYANPKRRVHNAYAQARTAIEQVGRNKHYDQLYHIFIQLFSDVYAVEPQHISLEFITQKLRVSGSSKELIAEWEDFFAQLSASAFGREIIGKDSKMDVAAMAWLGKLNGALK